MSLEQCRQRHEYPVGVRLWLVRAVWNLRCRVSCLGLGLKLPQPAFDPGGFKPAFN